MQITLSIDPGKTGAMAIFDSGALIGIVDATETTLAQALNSELRFGRSARVVIEQVNGMPGQSGPAAFNFGKGYGELLGVCLALKVKPLLVRPQDWKAKLGLRRDPSDTPTTWKSKSLILARETWPNSPWFKRAKDEGRAEAALLGYCALTQGFL